MSGGDNDLDGDDENKQEYVKKEFVARPYACTSGVLEEVEKNIVKNSRPLMHMRISRQRREFGLDGFNLIDKDASDFTAECKGTVKNLTPSRNKIRILHDGF